MNNEEQAQSFTVSGESVVIIETSSGDAKVEGWEEARVEVESSGRAARVHQEGAPCASAPNLQGRVMSRSRRHGIATWCCGRSVVMPE